MPGKTTTSKLTPDQMNRLIMWDNRITKFESKLTATKSFEAWRTAYWGFFNTTINNADIKQMVYSEYKDLPAYEWDQFQKELDNTKWSFRNIGMSALAALNILMKS